ncbi:MAG: hypothetical protein ED559_13240 [Phycisphaera sp.]|nr:MAG: hypothetical protein ED559_13240 [Phycisphaera sp.]
MPRRTTLILAMLLVGIAPAGAQEAPAEAAQPEGESQTRTIDMRNAPPTLRLGIRVLSHRLTRSASPVLVVVDDTASYVEAISRWTPEVIFPVLIDDGSQRALEDIARFVRAYEPEQIVRFEAGETLPTSREAKARFISEKFASIWDIKDDEDLEARLVSHWQFAVHAPPGVVVADANDPAWTGALALAAGHTQPILWYDSGAILGGVDSDIGENQTQDLIDFIEFEIEMLGLSWQAPGDTIDAVTIAMNIPARCNLARIRERNSERFALTDVIGKHRALTSPRDTRLQRWAWAGQLIGNKTESAYRAMCSLFLQPERAWVFDGYPNTSPWNAYDGTKVAQNLARANIESTLLDSPTQGLDNWLTSTTRPIDADLVFVTTKGMASYYDLEPGRAHAPDVPFLDRPVAASFVHSWSATRPGDPNTIAGTWLDRGAHLYVGSVHEPYLQAFIPSPVLALRLAGGIPWGAAIRSDGGSPIWKITLLGDPLLAIGAPRPKAELVELDESSKVVDEVAELLQAEDFVGAARVMIMLGRDADATRLADAVLRERPEVFTAEFAELIGMPAFRVYNKDLLVACVLKSDEDTIDRSGMGDALWHAAESNIRTGVQAEMASALERSLRGSRIARDAVRLAGSLEATLGVPARNAMLDRIARSVSNKDTQRKILSAKR